MSGPGKSTGRINTHQSRGRRGNGNGRGRGRGSGSRSDRGRFRTNKQQGTTNKHDHQEEVASTIDVYEASDSDTGRKKMKRRNLEHVDVRDYEVDEIDSEDDEDIDSDDAFNESDEERFDSFRSVSDSKKRLKQKSASFDLDRDDTDSDIADSDSDNEEEEDEIDGEGTVDLSEMLEAGNSDDDSNDNLTPTIPEKRSDSGIRAEDLASRKLGEYLDSDKDSDSCIEGKMLSELESDSDNEDSRSSTHSQNDSNSDTEDEGKLNRLDNFVTSISAKAPKHKFVSEAGGLFAENENSIGSGLTTRGISLGISDLLGVQSSRNDDEESQDAGETQATKEIRALKDKVSRLNKDARNHGVGAVAAPLVKRLQDQVDRKVAYSKTKASISEWQSTVDANRTAEHLMFPMNDPSRVIESNASLVSRFSTKSDLESKIQSILTESGMTDEQQRQYEELELKQLTPEEARKRRRELRLMRELMFRNEQKARRTAKIKSKAYRKILKKEKTKNKEQAMEKLKEDDPEMYEMLMERMARSRAEERMSLRHKNTGKWAKSALKRSHGDDDTRQALNEQLEQHDSLKRKIYDLGSDEDVSDYEAKMTRGEADNSSGDESGSDEGDSFEAIKARTIKKLSSEMGGQDGSGNGDDNDDDLPDGTPHKALFGMKFMKNAMQRKREQAVRDAQIMRDEFESLEADIDEDGNVTRLKKGTAADSKTEKSKSESMAPGRMTFGGGVKKRQQVADGDTSDAESAPTDSTTTKRVRLNGAGQISQVESSDGHRVRLDGPVSISTNGKAPSDALSNPWLSEEAAGSSGNRNGKMHGLSKESTKVDKLTAKLRAKRLDSSNNDGSGDVLLDINKTLQISKPLEADESEGESGSDQDDIVLESSKRKGSKKSINIPTAFTQRDLVEQAFAEDNIVEEEFAAEKDAIIDEETPKDQDLTLPGWGSWGGTGFAKKNKIIRKAVKGEGVDKKKRKDAGKANVIINQRMVKSANKYYADKVPFPFYTPDQYEQTLQAPLGKEWNTSKSHSKMIKPRVITKMGKVIDPLMIPSKKRQ